MSSRPWELRQTERSDAEFEKLLDHLQKETGLSRLTLRICILRGLDSKSSIEAFLFPKLEDLAHPETIRDMKEGIERVVQARANGEKVRVFGDYDVDGTTGAALLSWVFRACHLKFDATQPDRFLDGYGLNVRAIEKAKEDGVSLLVTVDCGITSFDAAEKARELGVDLVIVDHHQIDPKRGLPPACAVINPQREDCPSLLRQLCGCGLAFFFSIALRAKGRELNWFAPGQVPNLKDHLDLVVIATAADMVPLTGVNHILVRYGLEVLRYSKKPGVAALLQASGLSSRSLSPGHLGFVLGPRINASGRMKSASLALELLSTEDASRAAELASELEVLNKERADLQNQIWDQVRKRIEESVEAGFFQHAIAVGDPEWHEGVIGIVASRVTETFHKPAAVISVRDGIGKGSVRSFAGKNVLEGLRACSDLLLGFGGHKHAAGFSLKQENLEAFSQAFDQALSQIQEDRQAKSLWVEGVCSIEDLDVQTLIEIERLGPFGPGNPEPVFILQAGVRGHRVIKGRHLRLDLESSLHSSEEQPSSGFESRRSFHKPRSVQAIWFGGAEQKDRLDAVLEEGVKEFAGVPEVNRFRGQVTPNFRLKDWRSKNSQPDPLGTQ